MVTPTVRRALVLFGHLLFAIGALLFISPVFLRWSGRSFATIPLPLPDAQAVARAPDGTLYVGDAMYGRVQRYDADGNFIRGWFVPFAGGKFFRLTLRGDTLSAWLFNSTIHLYDSLGVPLRTYDTTAAAHQGLVIETGAPGLYLESAAVVEKDSTGKIHRLATLADPLWFLSPILGMVVATIGVVIRLIARRIGTY